MEKIYIRVIESSSKGNCIVLYDGHKHLFLDFGADKKNIIKYFSKHNLSISNTAGALITHAHWDHVKSIGENISKSITFFCTNETKEHLINKNVSKEIIKNIISVNSKSKKWISIKNSNWKFKTFKTIHNISGSIGFVIKNKRKKILYLTDTEFFTNKIFKKMNCYIVESNYGTSKLLTKEQLNKHILNTKNHMSIDDAEKFLKTYYSRKTKLFIFSHLSINGEKDKKYIEDLVNYHQKNNINSKYIKPHEILNFEDEF